MSYLFYIQQCVYVSPNLPIYPSHTHTHFPFGNHKFVFRVCFCFVNKFICTLFLDSTYKQYHKIFVFLCIIFLSNNLLIKDNDYPFSLFHMPSDSTFCTILIIYLFIYLFIWLCQVLVVACRIFQLPPVGSLVAACRLLVAACGIQFPDQGSNPGPPAMEHGVLTTGPPGNSWY